MQGHQSCKTVFSLDSQDSDIDCSDQEQADIKGATYASKFLHQSFQSPDPV